MAFKLVGDQYDQIRKARKRRVSHLLAGNIPKDEVFKMRDGRIACLVCNNRPVFDTLQILSIHRKGKKHLQSVHKRVKEDQIKTATHSHNTDDGISPLLTQTNTVLSHFHDTKQSTIEQCTSSVEYSSSTTNNYYKKEVSLNVVTRPSKPLEGEEKEREKESTTSLALLTDNDKTCNDDYGRMSNKKYIEMRSSGWLPNYDGTWKKDPNVEFDTDDEEEEEERGNNKRKEEDDC